MVKLIRFFALFGLLNSPACAQTVFQGEFRDPHWLETFNSYVQPPWTEGLDRAEIIYDSDKTKEVLQILYPEHVFGNEKSGTQWITYLDRTYERLVLSYDVKFEKGFEFVKGGKLPGLIGGHQAEHPHATLTGGHKPNGKDGWSARIMWRRNGHIVQYVYHPDQPKNYGEDFPWIIRGEPVKFLPGHWHNVKTEIVMNTPGMNNGTMRSWFDGELALNIRNLRFRDIDDFGIDALYFSTFFGGDDATWSPSVPMHAYFDRFEIWR